MIKNNYNNFAGFKLYKIKMYKILFRKPINGPENGVKICYMYELCKNEGKCVKKSTNLAHQGQISIRI
jgi:hypothetical protein